MNSMTPVGNALRGATWSILSENRRQLSERVAHGRRRGISLLEVLISMFVMLFGLMGVAAMFPVGNHYAAQGAKYDRASSAAPMAFAEMKTRGMLRPEKWAYGVNTALATGGGTNSTPYYIIDPQGVFLQSSAAASAGVGSVGRAFVLDPLGSSEANQTQDSYFPEHVYLGTSGGMTGETVNSQMPGEWASQLRPLFGATSSESWPIRRISLVNAIRNSVVPQAVANQMCRFADDIANSVPKANDQPGQQLWKLADLGSGSVPVNRQSTGSFTWLATIVPENDEELLALQPSHPSYGQLLYEVSVAVFSKRTLEPEPDNERSMTAEMQVGNTLVVYTPSGLGKPEEAMEAVNNALKDIRAGNWIAVAGVHPTTGAFLLKWYRILAIDDEVKDIRNTVPVYQGSSGGGNGGTSSASAVIGRRLTLDGPDWPMSASLGHAPNLRAIILPNVIGVTTQALAMQSDSPWTMDASAASPTSGGGVTSP